MHLLIVRPLFEKTARNCYRMLGYFLASEILSMSEPISKNIAQQKKK